MSKRNAPKRVFVLVLILALIAALAVGYLYLVLGRAVKPDGGAGANDTAASAAPASDEPASAAPEETEQLPQIDPDTYYAEIGEVLSVTETAKSDAVQTEKDVTAELRARGFTEKITTSYAMGGKFLDEAAVSADSTDRHPVYEMYFTSSEKVLWLISEVNGVIMAQPLTYLNDNPDSPVLLAEGESVTAYDSASDSFYELVPSRYTLKTVDRIDFETLDGLTLREVEQL